MVRTKREANDPTVLRELRERNRRRQVQENTSTSSSNTAFLNPLPCVDLEAEVPSSSALSSSSAPGSSRATASTLDCVPIPRRPIDKRIGDASASSNCKDFSEKRSRHCLRVATQREIRKSNPPPRQRGLKTCLVCNISVTAGQCPAHLAGKRHLRAFLRATEKYHCVVCDRDFSFCQRSSGSLVE